MMKNAKIVIVDYGVGNLRSLIRAFEHFGVDVAITEEADKISLADALVLPGDGAFAAGMEGLKVRGLTKAVLDFANESKPLLGICLGAQILMGVGYEFGKFKGLGLISGKVVKFNKKIGAKIPQIGWNNIYPGRKKDWRGTILEGVNPQSNVYFIHSYIVVPKVENAALALTNYGTSEFCSVVYKDQIWGCQFHPEKSGQVGLKIIGNFIKMVKAKG